MSLQSTCNLTEGKSFGGRRTFATDRAILMSTLVRLIGSLRSNLDKKMIAQAVSDYAGLKEEFKDALFGILDSFKRGELTAEAMEGMWRSEIKDAWEKAYGLGVRSVGNPFGVWEQDKTWLKGAETEEFGYLGKFVEDIKKNELEMGIEDRLEMYSETLDGVFNHGKVDGSPEFVRIHWILNDAKHCFPAGTKISTPDGERAIEEISVGDTVDTLEGPKKVTKTYQRDYCGGLIEVVSGKDSVRCTPNHPFLTRDGWVASVDLRKDSQIMFKKNGSNFVYRKIVFPYSANGIATSPKVGVLGTVPTPLLDLPFVERFIAGMTVPPFAVKLNNQSPDTNVHYKFWFNEYGVLKAYSKLFKNLPEDPFSFARLISLNGLICGHKLGMYLSAFFRIIFSPLFDLFHIFRFFHRIKRFHVSLCGCVDDLLGGLFRKANSEFVHFTVNRRLWNQDLLGDICRPLRSIVFEYVHVFFFRPIMPSYEYCSSTLDTSWSFDGPGKVLSTYQAFLADDEVPASCIGYVSTCNGTVSANSMAMPVFRKNTTTKFAGKMCGCYLLMANVFTHMRNLLYPKELSPVKVFNLEVEDVHHYIANGFVVHNCDDCIRFAAGSPYTKKTLVAVPRDGNSRCLSNCKCWLKFEYADEKPAPELYVIKGPKPVVPPTGYRLPSDNERDKLGQMSSEIDRLRGMIRATKGDQKKEFIRMRRDLNADLIDFMERHKIYYVPGGQMRKVKFVESIADGVKKELLLEGGPGSGHFGHKGRPDKRGGSLPGGSVLAHGYTGVGDWVVKRGVRISASPSEKKRIHKFLSDVPVSHLKLSGVKTITVMNNVKEVDDLYKLRSGDNDRSFTADAFYDHNTKEMVLSPGAQQATVLHEFAHTLVGLGAYKKRVWDSNASSGKVTRYGSTDMHEGFCEAYALRVVDKDYLRKKAPKVADVMDKVFEL